MDAILECCCGIDVHKKDLKACLLVGSLSQKPQVTIKSFTTMTDDLLKLRDWLEQEGCTQIAIESTGVYWKPVFNILEDSMTIILANARDIKNVPGRKTDIKDCQWIAQLLRCGLVKASFIPPKPIRDLRDLTRYRKKLTFQLSAEKNRVQKILEDCNIKLSSVATDIFGVSGMLMINALLDGNTNTTEMAELAKGTLRNKIKDLESALTGNVTDHHRFMIGQSLDYIRYLNHAISDMDNRIDSCIEPYRKEIELLEEIPGIEKKTAECIIAEIGVDMAQFPSAAHLSSWAGMSPGNNESAGKRRSGKTTHGNKWLGAALVEAAWSASKKKGSYLKSRYYRIASRRGKKRAAVAIGHTMLVVIYHMLKNGLHYAELGEEYFDRINKDKTRANLVKRLEKLGHKVILEPLPEVA